jgi:hypothetical protein
LERLTVSVLLYVVAVVLFVLAPIPGGLLGLSELDEIALGLAAFTLAHVIP